MRPRPYTRILGYVRVSGREQGKHGTSLAGQKSTIKGHGARLGIPVARIWVEVESASPEKLERRAELAELLREARPGDLIAVSLLDRWSRDLGYTVVSVRALVAKGIGWIAIEESIDASTPEGDSALGMRAWAADEERKRIRRRTVGRRAELKDLGFYVEGPAPYGTRRGPRAQGLQRTLVEEPEEARFVREAFERARRQTLLTIIDWLEVETERSWDKKSVWSLLRNRVYLGEVKDGAGNWIRSPHVPALVTRQAFERAQTAMTARRLDGPKATKRTVHWLLRGLGSCPDCGARMGANFGHEPAPWGWYVCGARLRRGTCSAPWARVQEADQLAEGLALARLAEIREELARPRAPRSQKGRKRDFGAERRRLEQAQARIARGYVDGVISAEHARRERERLDLELQRLDVAIAEAERAIGAQTPEARRELLGKVGAIERAWARSRTDQRREVLCELAKNVVIRPGRVEIEWKTIDEMMEGES